MALPTVPSQWPGRVGIGSLVEVIDEKDQTQRYFIAGDWTARAGQAKQGALVMSIKAPLASLLAGKKPGEVVTRHGKRMGIVSVIHIT